MNTIEVKTPHGYIATIATDLNFRQYKEIKRIATSSIVIDGKTNARKDTSASFVEDISEKAMSMLLVKLVGPEGGELAEPYNAINDIPAIDGKMIAEKIDEIYASISIDEKKGGLIEADIYAAFYSGNFQLLPPDLSDNFICDALGITYTELMRQPAGWVNRQMIFLAGKNRAQKKKMEEANKRR